MNPKIEKFAPAVDKRFLIVLSGITWSIVGIILCNLAVNWLLQSTFYKGIWLGLAGIVLSLLIHHFGFLRLVDRNIERILSKKDKVCIFAFQAWKSYLIVAIMVGMGIALKRSPLPKPYLSVIYIGFGGAMIFSSIRYYRVFLKLILNT
jgi:small-conductance mechanosensitive channel